jgi:hypothetical protein
MPQKDNFLYSLIPLLIILAFSWLFGLFSKRRAQQQAPPAEASKERANPLLELLLEKRQQDEDVELIDVPDERQRQDGAQETDWRSRVGYGGPKIDSKPITPKWWGA